MENLLLLSALCSLSISNIFVYKLSALCRKKRVLVHTVRGGHAFFFMMCNNYLPFLKGTSYYSLNLPDLLHYCTSWCPVHLLWYLVVSHVQIAAPHDVLCTSCGSSRCRVYQLCYLVVSRESVVLKRT